jgi:hypothetical protein
MLPVYNASPKVVNLAASKLKVDWVGSQLCWQTQRRRNHPAME